MRKNQEKRQSKTLLDILREEKTDKYQGGIYHKTQIDLTYNSNHMEGSRLTHDQTRYIFETNTIGVENEVLNVDDVIETANHFRCIDMIIDDACMVLTEKLLKLLHLTLKNGTSDSRKDWFAVGDYKKMPNEVGGMETTLPEQVFGKIKKLLAEYNAKEEKSLEDILDFHVKFERIHPFQDGNGRLSRLISTLLLLKNGYKWIEYVSFEHEIESRKTEYYRVLRGCQANRPNEDVSNWVSFFFDALLNIQSLLMKKLENQGVEYQLSPREKSIVTFISGNAGCKSGDIAQRLGIPAPTVKRILSDLTAKNLIEKFGAGAGTNYSIK